ncbi:MAG: hypothetical protein A3C82_01645 [Candidatus Wildermuthbacteria bacterium RIFCSPHIGHO2_02_FULL_47_12]|uniref:Uncharacterized protein n=1 Tax=Candidatus Wildermuthbacteria bacterium RIFCSPHIGHO2_02_FULL_47_12 TaxID=1802451 RepID=A0A1G2R506_9BACT|nr:MAG: hypothetical protein A3C82_01645 [Candidatus Wildermuthbacteria bacterium RIFCSPHIGHO2_02_FULL_47_12]
MASNLVLDFVVWFGKEVPLTMLKAWRNTLWFAFHYFSLSTLVSTLFSPWRRYTWSHKGGFSIGGYFEAAASNLFSRVIGAAMRLPIIAVGLAAAAIAFLAGAAVLILWFLLPLIIFLLFFHGIRILF